MSGDEVSYDSLPFGRHDSMSSMVNAKELKLLNKKRRTLITGRTAELPFYNLIQQFSEKSDSDTSIPQEESLPAYATRDIVAVINAIICCEKCSLLTRQVQSWALEDYVGEKEQIKCELRCSIAFGSVIDIHFGVTRIKCNTLCAGTAFALAQRLLVDDVARGKIYNKLSKLGSIIISNTIYEMTAEAGMPFVDGKKIELGFVINPVPRKNTDSIFTLISNVSDHILYCDVKQRKYTTLIETYLCDQTSQIFKKKHEKVLTDEDLKSRWEKCSAMAVRIKNASKKRDQYYSSIELCKRIQEILIKVQRITWANDTFTYHVNTDIDKSAVIHFIAYDGDVPVNKCLIL